MTFQELCAVMKGLELLDTKKWIQESLLLVVSDNIGAVQVLESWRSKEASLALLLEEKQAWVGRIRAFHQPGVKNVAADIISREADSAKITAALGLQRL